MQCGDWLDVTDALNGEVAGTKCYRRERCAIECKDDGIIGASLIENAGEQSREPERYNDTESDPYGSECHSLFENEANDAGALRTESHTDSDLPCALFDIV